MNGSSQLRARLVAPVVAKALRSAPVVVVTGARQTGKSTLVHSLLPGPARDYVSLDDIEILERAREEPDALVRSAPRLTLDEVQRSPELLLAVKRAVDEDRRPGRFLLTGSANLLLMQRVAETLAGRAFHVVLWPLTQGEQAGAGRSAPWAQLMRARDQRWPKILEGGGGKAGDWRAAVRRGGYPTPSQHLRDAEARALWHAGYTQTYLERDLRELADVASLIGFRRLMRAACLRLGSLVNQSELGRDIGLPQPTVRRHLDLLEVSYQLVRVPVYAVNRTKRLIKTPKLYWCDTALALHLSGESEPRGAHFENLVLADLIAWQGATPDAPTICYWRTVQGQEVDFVIEWQGNLLPIEVKATRRARLADAKNLRLFREEYPESRAGLLVHGGDELGWIAKGVLAVPWWRLLA